MLAGRLRGPSWLPRARRRECGHPRALTRQLYALSWWQALPVLLARQWKLTLRDAALVRGRIIQVRAALAACARSACLRLAAASNPAWTT